MSSHPRGRIVRLLVTALLVVGGIAGAAAPAQESREIKPLLRTLFGQVSANLNFVPASLPEGVRLVQQPECSGLVFAPGKVRIRPHVWTTDEGLLEEIGNLEASDSSVLAGINGAFYRKDGILGNVIINREIPAVKQFPGKLPKCFLAIADEEGTQRWVIGETTKRAGELLRDRWLNLVSLNRPLKDSAQLVHLIGGGGWIIRDSHDVHMESYQRQNFRFRRVDQDSRHTVIAVDRRDQLFLLVFETGSNLQTISEILRGRPEFGDITEAVFFDGGSSSTLVCQGKYLVAPLYLIDKSRFSAILAFRP